MTSAIQAYERNLRTISIGSCAPGPLLELIPELTERFYGMALTSETVSSKNLLPGLEKGTYQLIITASEVTAPDILCRPFCSEQLYLTVPPAHPLAICCPAHTAHLHPSPSSDQTPAVHYKCIES